MQHTRFIPPDGLCIRIGRAVDNDLVFQADFISNYHGIVFVQNGFVYYRDMSTNGTIVNHAMIHHDTVMIQSGDEILLSGRIPLEWQTIERYIPSKSNVMPDAANTDQSEQPPINTMASSGEDHKKSLRKSAYVSIIGGVLLFLVGVIATSMSDKYIYTGALAVGGYYVLLGIYRFIKSFSTRKEV